MITEGSYLCLLPLLFFWISGVGLEVLGLKVFRDFLGVGLDPVEVGHEFSACVYDTYIGYTYIPIDIDILGVTRIGDNYRYTKSIPKAIELTTIRSLSHFQDA